MADPSAISTTHLILIAVIAAIVIIGIWWGIRSRRGSGTAPAVTEERRPAVDTVTAPAPPAPVAVAAPPPAPVTATPSVPEPAAPEAVTPPPVAPAPPPLADEPIVAAAAFDASPAALAADLVANTPVAPALAGAITQLKGLGPKLAAQLAELGVTRVDQIAAMSPAEIEALDAKLGTFKGRIARDRWVEQARLLTAGDRAAYEAEFGKLGG